MGRGACGQPATVYDAQVCSPTGRSCSLSANSGSVEIENLVLATPEVVDYGSRGYSIQVTIRNDHTSNAVRFYGLRIRYTTTQVGG